MTTPTLTPLPDSSGFSFTPTLHSSPSSTTSPSNTILPTPFTVCIIGASRGIGASIAFAYAIAGASTLILAARSLIDLEVVATETRAFAKPGTTVITAHCDIASDSSVAMLAATVRHDVGRLDVLVVNSAYYGKLVIDVTQGEPLEWQRVININVTGAYLAAHYFVPLLLQTEGGAKAFLAISSLAAWITGGIVAHTAVCVSKLAQVRLIEHMSEQYREDGLLAVALHPGCVRTEMAQAAPDEFRKC